MLRNVYRVNFGVKKGGYKSYVIDIEANNLKEARKAAESLWYEHRTSHMFHITVRRLKDTEEFLYNYFSRVKGA